MDWRERKQRRHEQYHRDVMRNLHHFSIPTTKSRLIHYCRGSKMAHELQAIIGLGQDHPEYGMRLAVFSWQAYFLFQLTYLSRAGVYKKLPAERYAELLFIGWAERPEELSRRYFTDENRESGFRIYKAVCDTLCPMIAHTGPDRFWPEYVTFLVDYIVQEQGNVPKPDMAGSTVPYPHNFPRPWERNRVPLLPEEINV